MFQMPARRSVPEMELLSCCLRSRENDSEGSALNDIKAWTPVCLEGACRSQLEMLR